MPIKDVGDAIREMRAGQLHSGSKSGPLVTNRKQAIAIALSEMGQLRKKALLGKRKPGKD